MPLRAGQPERLRLPLLGHGAVLDVTRPTRLRLRGDPVQVCSGAGAARPRACSGGKAAHPRARPCLVRLAEFGVGVGLRINELVGYRDTFGKRITGKTWDNKVIAVLQARPCSCFDLWVAMGG